MTKYQDFIGYVEKKEIHGRVEKNLCFVDLTGEKGKITGTVTNLEMLAEIIARNYGREYEKHITYNTRDIRKVFSDRVHQQFDLVEKIELQAFVEDYLYELEEKMTDDEKCDGIDENCNVHDDCNGEVDERYEINGGGYSVDDSVILREVNKERDSKIVKVAADAAKEAVDYKKFEEPVKLIKKPFVPNKELARKVEEASRKSSSLFQVKNGLQIPEISLSLYSPETRKQAQKLINNFYANLEKTELDDDFQKGIIYELTATEKVYLKEGFAPAGKKFLKNFQEFDEFVKNLYFTYGIDKNAHPNSRFLSLPNDLRSFAVFVRYLKD